MQLFRPHSSSVNLTPEHYVERGSAREQKRIYLPTADSGLPSVKTNKKDDAADAVAICEAVGRPNMRFVPIKSIEQQAILSVHRATAIQATLRPPSAQKLTYYNNVWVFA